MCLLRRARISHLHGPVCVAALAGEVLPERRGPQLDLAAVAVVALPERLLRLAHVLLLAPPARHQVHHVARLKWKGLDIERLWD